MKRYIKGWDKSWDYDGLSAEDLYGLTKEELYGIDHEREYCDGSGCTDIDLEGLVFKVVDGSLDWNDCLQMWSRVDDYEFTIYTDDINHDEVEVFELDKEDTCSDAAGELEKYLKKHGAPQKGTYKVTFNQPVTLYYNFKVEMDRYDDEVDYEIDEWESCSLGLGTGFSYKIL